MTDVSRIPNILTCAVTKPRRLKMSDPPAIVIDNGSLDTKAGLSGEESPSHVFRTCISDDSSAGEGEQRCPIERGTVTNWDEMEKVWKHTFEKLDVDQQLHRVMVAETARNPIDMRAKIAQIMFEKFQVQKLFIARQGVLSLYAAGLMTGCAFDSGNDLTHALLIKDGYAQAQSITYLDIGGQDLTGYLGQILSNPNLSLDQNTLSDIKEKLCYVRLNEDERIDAKTYNLPDGQSVVIKSESFRCPEAFFHPNVVDQKHGDLTPQQLILRSASKCDEAVRQELCSSIVLSGGNTLFDGMKVRMEKELQLLLPHKFKVRASPERRHSVWIGGSILAAVAAFDQMWIGKEEYGEHGSSIIAEKCF